MGEVGCVFGAWAAESEDSGFGGDLFEDLVGIRGGEVDDVIEVEGCGHETILSFDICLVLAFHSLRLSSMTRNLAACDSERGARLNRRRMSLYMYPERKK